MGEISELIEAIEGIKKGSYEPISLEEITLLEPHKTALLYYYLLEYSVVYDVPSAHKFVNDWIKKSFPNDKKLHSNIASRAFDSAVYFDLLSFAEEILYSNELIVDSDSIFQLFQKGRDDIIKQIVIKRFCIRGIKRTCNIDEIVHAMQGLVGEAGYKKEHPKVMDIVDFATQNLIHINTIFTFCINCKDLNDTTAINAMLSQKREFEAIFLLKLYMRASPKSLKIAFEKSALKYAVKFTRMGIRIRKGKHHDVFAKLFEKTSINGDLGNIEVYMFIIKKYINSMDWEDVSKFSKIIDELSEPVNAPILISRLLNPFKIVVHLAELCTIFADSFDFLKIQFERTKQNLFRLGVTILQEIKSAEQFRFIINDKNLDGEDSLTIILEQNLIDFFNSALFGEIASESWSGPYNTSIDPFTQLSCIYKITTGSICEPGDTEGRISKKCFNRDIQTFQSTLYEYQVWKNSAGLRMSFYFMECLLLAFGLFGGQFYVQQKLSAMIEAINAIGNREWTMDDYNLYVHFTYEIVYGYSFWEIILIGVILSSARAFTIPAYQYLAGLKMDIFNIDWIVNLLLLPLSVSLIIMVDENQTLSLKRLKMSEDQLVAMMPEYKYDRWSNLVQGILLGVLGFRIIYLIRLSSFLGPLICIVTSMTKKIVQFALFYFIVIFVFALVATMIFSAENPAYKSIDIIILTLFETSLGVFTLNPPDTFMEEAKAFIVIFVFIVNIMLLSLLISILNDVYIAMMSKQNCIYYREVITLRKLYSPQDTYQFMVSSYFIFDVIISIIVLPIMLFMNPLTRKIMNKILLHLEYTLCFIVMLPIFIAIEIILIPIAYIFSAFQKTKLLFGGNTNGMTFKMALWNLIKFIIFGSFFLLGYMIADIYYCIIYAYRHIPRSTYVDDSYAGISRNSLKKLVLFLDEFTHRKVACKVFFNHMKTILMANESKAQLHDKLFPYIPNMYWITQYSVISRFVKSIANCTNTPKLIEADILRDLFNALYWSQQVKFKQKQKGLKQKLINQIQIEEKYTISKNIWDLKEEDGSVKIEMTAVRLYTREQYETAAKKYSVDQISVGELMLELRKEKNSVIFGNMDLDEFRNPKSLEKIKTSINNKCQKRKLSH